MAINSQEAGKVYWDRLSSQESFMRRGTSLVRQGERLILTSEQYDSEDQRQYTAIVHFDPRIFFDGISRLNKEGKAFIRGKKPYEECGIGVALRSDRADIAISIYARIQPAHYMEVHEIVPRETFHEEEAIAAVIAANAQISPDQFQAFQHALGQEVEMQYDYHKIYSDEEPSSRDKTTEKFILRDVNFVRYPGTDRAYLAFLRTDDATNFSYWSSENAFGDFTEVQITSLRLPSGKELWRFDHPGERVTSDRWGSANIIQNIKDHSESMLALVMN